MYLAFCALVRLFSSVVFVFLSLRSSLFFFCLPRFHFILSKRQIEKHPNAELYTKFDRKNRLTLSRLCLFPYKRSYVLCHAVLCCGISYVTQRNTKTNKFSTMEMVCSARTHTHTRKHIVFKWKCEHEEIYCVSIEFIWHLTKQKYILNWRKIESDGRADFPLIFFAQNF